MLELGLSCIRMSCIRPSIHLGVNVCAMDIVLGQSRLYISGNAHAGVKVDSVRPGESEVSWHWPLSMLLS